MSPNPRTISRRNRRERAAVRAGRPGPRRLPPGIPSSRNPGRANGGRGQGNGGPGPRNNGAGSGQRGPGNGTPANNGRGSGNAGRSTGSRGSDRWVPPPGVNGRGQGNSGSDRWVPAHGVAPRPSGSAESHRRPSPRTAAVAGVAPAQGLSFAGRPPVQAPNTSHTFHTSPGTQVSHRSTISFHHGAPPAVTANIMQQFPVPGWENHLSQQLPVPGWENHLSQQLPVPGWDNHLAQHFVAHFGVLQNMQAYSGHPYSGQAHSSQSLQNGGQAQFGYGPNGMNFHPDNHARITELPDGDVRQSSRAPSTPVARMNVGRPEVENPRPQATAPATASTPATARAPAPASSEKRTRFRNRGRGRGGGQASQGPQNGRRSQPQGYSRRPPRRRLPKAVRVLERSRDPFPDPSAGSVTVQMEGGHNHNVQVEVRMEVKTEAKMESDVPIQNEDDQYDPSDPYWAQTVLQDEDAGGSA
ncbi:hypothetical protein EDC01DRAFT_726117 [Geopyxis carbonaria]|nr:hypothetical protein EDC01DRAFT_726117 [Geopyxis carbonaria]